jgi:hypothetical protein
VSYRINNILGEYEVIMQSSWQQIKALFISDAGQHIPSFYTVGEEVDLQKQQQGYFMALSKASKVVLELIL